MPSDFADVFNFAVVLSDAAAVLSDTAASSPLAWNDGVALLFKFVGRLVLSDSFVVLPNF